MWPRFFFHWNQSIPRWRGKSSEKAEELHQLSSSLYESRQLGKESGDMGDEWDYKLRKVDIAWELAPSTLAFNTRQALITHIWRL